MLKSIFPVKLPHTLWGFNDSWIKCKVMMDDWCAGAVLRGDRGYLHLQDITYPPLLPLPPMDFPSPLPPTPLLQPHLLLHHHQHLHLVGVGCNVEPLLAAYLERNKVAPGWDNILLLYFPFSCMHLVCTWYTYIKHVSKSSIPSISKYVSTRYNIWFLTVKDGYWGP